MSEINDESDGHSGRDAAGQTPLANLWAEYRAGQTLAASDHQRLLTALHDQPTFRQAVMHEQWIDQLLNIEFEDEAKSRAFVDRVLRRCRDEIDHRPGASEDDSSEWTIAGAHLPTAEYAVIERPRPVPTVSDNRFGGRGWLVAVAVLLMCGSGFWFWRRTDQNNVLPQEPSVRISRVDEPTANDDQHSSTAPDSASTSALAQADTPPEAGDERIGQPILDVDSADLRLTLAGGVVVLVFAPSRVQVLAEDVIHLYHGELSATVPPAARGFQVRTPSLVVTDFGTVFDVAVSTDGTTDVEVRDGYVSVASLDPTRHQQWMLDASDTHQLTFFAGPMQTPEPQGSQPTLVPVAALARRQSGEATGIISFAGRSLKFDDDVVFDTVRERVFRGAQEEPARLAATWDAFVDSRSNAPPPTGSLTLNGQEFEFQNFNEAVRTQNRVLGQFAPGLNATGPVAHDPKTDDQGSAWPTTPVGGFRGSLMINGQQRNFESLQEYQAALRDLFGPGAELGFLPFQK